MPLKSLVTLWGRIRHIKVQDHYQFQPVRESFAITGIVFAVLGLYQVSSGLYELAIFCAILAEAFARDEEE